ncbi:HAD-IA family hydrolase [Undibacterium sp. Ji50W]|uniref:HAD-IA family hydrolase n=1 Tax=Undibacterium sp. Ji50W TaxID=3413041 RepID=UPI003BF0C52C
MAISTPSNMKLCLIFDCDGTLVDSEELCNLGLQTELLSYGIEEDTATLTRRFRGWKLADICSNLEMQHGLTFNPDFITRYRQTVDKLFESHLQAFPGVVDTLSKLRLPVCVASAAPRGKIKKALSLTGLSEFFEDRIYSSYDIQSWKPEPDLFLYAARQMDFLPHQCIVIEDSEVGIEAAKRAGMPAFWFRPDAQANATLDVQVFTDMRELPFFLQQREQK